MCVKPLEAQHEIHTLFNFRLHQHLIRVHWRGQIHEREACWQWSSVKLHSVELLRDIIASDHHPHIHQRLGHILQIDLRSMLLLCLQVVQNDVPPVLNLLRQLLAIWETVIEELLDFPSVHQHGSHRTPKAEEIAPEI